MDGFPRLYPEPSALLFDAFPLDDLRGPSASLQTSKTSQLLASRAFLSHNIDSADIFISIVTYLLSPSNSTAEMSIYGLNAYIPTPLPKSIS